MNPEFRKRILLPSLIPIGAFVFIGALVFGFSRLLLVVPKDGSVIVGVLMAGCILFAAGALSKGGRLKDSQRAALALFGVLVIGGGVAAGAALHTREVEKEAELAATLVARNTAFDLRQFSLPADTPVRIELDNQDPGIFHNISIYASPAPGARAFLTGATFPGVDTRVEELEEGLPTGVYFFRCDVHATIPAMTGNVIVGNAPTPQPTPTATGPAPAPTSPAPSPTTTPA